MNVFAKIFFIVLALAGIIATFYLSWFWRGLIIPMILIVIADVVYSFVKKKK